MSEAVESGSLDAPAAATVETPRAAPAPVRRSRVANIDRLRLLALAEILVFHTTGGHMLAGIGLPTFLLFTVALNARPHRTESDHEYVYRKSTTFLLPWVVWSIVYAIVQTVAPLARGGDPFKWFEPVMLVVGTQRHLWYMIFALVASLVAYSMYRRTARLGDNAVIVAGALLACLIMIPEHFAPLTDAWTGDWLIALPALPLGLALGRCIHATDARARRTRMLILAAITVAGMTPLALLDLGYGAKRFAMAIVPVAIVVMWSGAPDRVTSWLTQLRLGVYLSHMLIIGALHFVGVGEQNNVVRSAIVIVGSVLLTWGITLTPLRWMVQPSAITSRKPSLAQDRP